MDCFSWITSTIISISMLAKILESTFPTIFPSVAVHMGVMVLKTF